MSGLHLCRSCRARSAWHRRLLRRPRNISTASYSSLSGPAGRDISPPRPLNSSRSTVTVRAQAEDILARYQSERRTPGRYSRFLDPTRLPAESLSIEQTPHLDLVAERWRAGVEEDRRREAEDPSKSGNSRASSAGFRRPRLEDVFKRGRTENVSNIRPALPLQNPKSTSSLSSSRADPGTSGGTIAVEYRPKWGRKGMVRSDLSRHGEFKSFDERSPADILKDRPNREQGSARPARPLSPLSQTNILLAGKQGMIRPVSKSAGENRLFDKPSAADIPKNERHGEQGPAGPARTLLEVMRENRVPLTERWRFFKEHFGSRSSPAFRTPSFGDVRFVADPRHFGAFGRELMDAWCRQEPGWEDLPCPSVLHLHLHELKCGIPDYWVRTLRDVNQALVMESSSQEPKTPDRLLHLVQLWRDYIKFVLPDLASQTKTDEDWSWLPEVAATNVKSLSNVLNQTFKSPRFTLEFSQHIQSHALIATFCLLVHARSDFRLTEAQLQRCWPFVIWIARVIRSSNATRSQDRLYKSPFMNDLSADARQKWTDIIKGAHLDAEVVEGEQDIITEPMKSLEPMESPEATTPGRVASAQAFIIKRLARAVESESLGAVDRLWAEVQQLYTQEEITEKVMRQFMLAFMRLKAGQNATEIWNIMMRRGIRPSDETWTTVITGCLALKDADALDYFWGKLLESGHNPSTYNWNARISSLMKFGFVEKGLLAMTEMGRRWVNSERQFREYEAAKAREPELDGEAPVRATRPDNRIVNAVLRTLCRRHYDWETIQGVLDWAKRFEIPPDAYTFNPLIDWAYSMHDPDKAVALLRQMEELGIEPDPATHAVTIKHMFRMEAFRDETDPKETMKKVKYILKDLKERKMLTPYVFTALVQGLIQQGNIQAVRMTIEVIYELGQFVPAPVLTLLSRFYFTQDPPDIEGADILWARAMTGHAVLDAFFFDRMIEGYGRYMETGKMMTVLTRMAKESRRPSWRALSVVLETLVRSGEVETARQVVRDCRATNQGGGQFVYGGRDGRTTENQFSRSDFWDRVQQMGLESEEPIAEVYLPRPLPDRSVVAQTNMGDWMAQSLQKEKGKLEGVN